MKKGRQGTANILLGALTIAAALWLRHIFCGWLLPDGSRLEELVRCIGRESVAESVFSEVADWLSR